MSALEENSTQKLVSKQNRERGVVSGPGSVSGPVSRVPCSPGAFPEKMVPPPLLEEAASARAAASWCATRLACSRMLPDEARSAFRIGEHLFPDSAALAMLAIKFSRSTPSSMVGLSPGKDRDKISNSSLESIVIKLVTHHLISQHSYISPVLYFNGGALPGWSKL